MVFQDLLTTKDDYLRASRALLREIIKQTKHEINFQAFCLGLMQERKEVQYTEMEFKVPLALALVLLDVPVVNWALLNPCFGLFFLSLCYPLKSVLVCLVSYPVSRHPRLPF